MLSMIVLAVTGLMVTDACGLTDCVNDGAMGDMVCIIIMEELAPAPAAAFATTCPTFSTVSLRLSAVAFRFCMSVSMGVGALAFGTRPWFELADLPRRIGERSVRSPDVLRTFFDFLGDRDRDGVGCFGL